MEKPIRYIHMMSLLYHSNTLHIAVPCERHYVYGCIGCSLRSFAIHDCTIVSNCVAENRKDNTAIMYKRIRKY